MYKSLSRFQFVNDPEKEPLVNLEKGEQDRILAKLSHDASFICFVEILGSVWLIITENIIHIKKVFINLFDWIFVGFLADKERIYI